LEDGEGGGGSAPREQGEKLGTKVEEGGTKRNEKGTEREELTEKFYSKMAGG
jgi:hypothetical protein